MFKVIAVVMLVTVPVSAMGQSIHDQIDAVYQAQERQHQAEQAEWAAQQSAQAARDTELRRERQRQDAIERARAGAAAATARAREAETAADKKRDQGYDDQLRSIALDEKRLDLQKRKAIVARENEFIDRELEQKSAETDVVRSQADSTRNVSSGMKLFLGHLGQQGSHQDVTLTYQ